MAVVLDSARQILNDVYMVTVTDLTHTSRLVAHHSDDPCGELDLYLDALDSFGVFDGMHERTCSGATCEAWIFRYGDSAELHTIGSNHGSAHDAA